MKILHLTTSHSGGAGVAALRLAHAQQRDLRTEAHVLTPRDSNDSTRGLLSRKKSALQSKILTAFQQVMATKDISFVSPISVSKLHWDYVRNFSPNVVHIHNWYNFLSTEDLNLLLKHYKVVFTAHDERLLTGGCHITFGCSRYHQDCISCPQVRFGSKIISNSANEIHRLLSDSKRYSIIAPSKWLTNKFQLAEFVNPANKMVFIPNIIPLELTLDPKPLEGTYLKFLFITDSATSSNKGLPEALEALNKLSGLNPEMKFELQIAGIEKIGRSTNHRNLKVISLGIINEYEMRARYRMVNALIVASKSENSPNVISEAQIHGAIVIGHAVGGIPELIIHNETGILYRNGKDPLLSALVEFNGFSEEKRNEIRRAAWNNAVSRHDPIKLLDDTYSVYAELLERDTN